MKKVFLYALCVLALCCGSAFAQTTGSSEKSSMASTNTGSETTGIHTPLFVGGALGFGSGTGVGTERGFGLQQIEPMAGIWFPQVAFFRAGYGFFDFTGENDDGEKTEIEHVNLDVELGVHLLGDIYLVGNFSRIKELSDEGDVAWNEWGIGVGSVLNIFSKTMLFAEIGYRHVFDHFDPFLDKNISGSRLQMNFGFVAYVY
ncbi:MAG: hypothetical protein IKZ45_07275 [Fibrobacter sp.]|nr:hypothetical protein [Fibrobacter sp.]